MKDIVIFLGLRMFNSDNCYMFSCIKEMRKSHLLRNYKTGSVGGVNSCLNSWEQEVKIDR